jgi:hypothetical protein
MKIIAIIAAAATLALPPANAASPDRDLIALESISFVVLQKCGFEFIDGGAKNAADKVGADFDLYAPAAMNAIFAIMEWEYDRSKLIPEVTRFVRQDLNELADDLKKRGQAGFCKHYGEIMLRAGWMKKKGF